MSDQIYFVPGLDPETKAARKARIQAILAHGNLAVFTYPATGAVKKVKEWNEDSDGDLKAFSVEGSLNPYVCWSGVGPNPANLSEETP